MLEWVEDGGKYYFCGAQHRLESNMYTSWGLYVGEDGAYDPDKYSFCTVKVKTKTSDGTGTGNTAGPNKTGVANTKVRKKSDLKNKSGSEKKSGFDDDEDAISK